MGKSNDSSAVVDSMARVIGVKSLRVVDASAFPLLPPGHPQATICKFSTVKLTLFANLTGHVDAFAEKIAAEILQGK